MTAVPLYDEVGETAVGVDTAPPASLVSALPSRPRATVDFIHEQAPPADWIARVRALSPQNEEHSSLYLWWEPGEPWNPWQRWVIYDTYHPRHADFETLIELEGPNPRTIGHLCVEDHLRPPSVPKCYCRRKTNAWRGEKERAAPSITLSQWRIYQRTGRVAEPWWVIQGAKGGHKVRFTSEEQEFLALEGYPTDPPAPGDLPYAPFDERVERWIVRHNRLVAFRNSLVAFRRARGPEYQQHREAAQRELRRQTVAFLTEQLEPETDLFIRAADQGDVGNAPDDGIDWARVEDASTAHYIETGNLLHPSMVQAPVMNRKLGP